MRCIRIPLPRGWPRFTRAAVFHAAYVFKPWSMRTEEADEWRERMAARARFLRHCGDTSSAA